MAKRDRERSCVKPASIRGLPPLLLVAQGAESFLLWRGVRPDTAPVIAELRRALR